MILSFFRRGKNEITHTAGLSKELDAMIGVLSRENPDDCWLARLQAFRDRAALLGESSLPEQWNILARDVLSIYGGMRSFNDNMYRQHLRDQQGVLYSAAENTVRATRRELGGTWVNIPDAQQFLPGQSVVLVNGEAIALQRDETAVRAPSSHLIYKVFERISNDIDNMPRYHIKSGSRGRYARHNALSKVDAP